MSTVRKNGASDDRAKAGKEFPGRKSLRDVVIRSEFETGDAVTRFAPPGKHENRNGRLLTDAAQDSESVQAGQHHIKDDGREVAVERFFEALGPCMGKAYVVA